MFQSPKDLVNCFEALENDGRLDIVAVSNGFLNSLKDVADEDTKPIQSKTRGPEKTEEMDGSGAKVGIRLDP